MEARIDHIAAATVHVAYAPDDARTYLRRPTEYDRDEFTDLMLRSRELHQPWIFPPVTEAAYANYLKRMMRSDHEGFLICQRADDAIVGVVNVNNIVHGAFLSAYLGYYAGAPYAGQGLMRDGAGQVVQYAFRSLGLHRLEANIQPGNRPSINLVKALGFRREGYSPDYLYIDGAWRDHERWAIVHGRDTLLPPGAPRDLPHRMP